MSEGIAESKTRVTRWWVAGVTWVSASQGGKERLLLGRRRTSSSSAAAAAEAVTLEAELTPVRADPSARHQPPEAPEQPYLRVPRQ